MNIQRLSPVIPGFASFLFALLSGLLLASTGLISGLVAAIINIGLDLPRAELIAALMTAAGTALIGAVGGRRKVAAMVGAGAFFCVSYLAGFVYLELQPVYDAGGNLEPLNGNMLVHTVLVMLALALLAAFIGSAVGIALGEVLLDPPAQLVQFTRQRRSRSHIQDNSTLLPKAAAYHPSRSKSVTPGSWLGAITMVALLLLASSSSDLFIFAPDIGLHTLPLIHNRTISVRGTIVHDEVVSPALGGQRKPFLVYLPPSYNTPAGRAKRYPTLYLLHGSPGRDSDWFTGGKADQAADTLIALGKIPELILILPDGNGRPGETSEWGNSFDHRQLIETYVAVDLVRYVDQKYRTVPEAAYRGIGGLSMGGFGAMNIAVHHPDLFGVVISLGGYYRAEGSIWGHNAAYMRANSSLDLLPSKKDAWRLHMYIGGATQDQPYYNYARQFVQELIKLHISYHLDIQNGFHSWQVWQTQIYNALTWIHWGVSPG